MKFAVLFLADESSGNNSVLQLSILKFSPVGTIKDTLQGQWNIKLLLVANAITKCKQIIFSIYQIKTV